jgi:hypothetical protein
MGREELRQTQRTRHPVYEPGKRAIRQSRHRESVPEMAGGGDYREHGAVGICAVPDAVAGNVHLLNPRGAAGFQSL